MPTNRVNNGKTDAKTCKSFIKWIYQNIIIIIIIIIKKKKK